MVERLDKDLLVYERRKRMATKEHSPDAEIVRMQDAVRDVRRHIDALNQERAALMTHRIDRKERALREIEDSYRKAGGDLYDRRIRIEGRWLRARQALIAGEVDLREFAAGPLPLLLVRALLEAIESRDRYEEQGRRARDLFAALKARDRAAISHLRAQSVDHAALDSLKAFLAADRARRQALGKNGTVLDISAEARGDLQGLLRSDLNDTAVAAARLCERQQAMKAEALGAQLEYDSVPDSDIIEQIAAKRDALKKEIAELRRIHEAIGQDIERQRRDLERRERTLARLVEDDARESGIRDDHARILQHARRARATLGTFRRAVIESRVRQIECLVRDCYRQLLRKSALVTGLSIDPESFSLTLFGRDGELLSANRLSAGERQLLAIALVWGLAKASGRRLPTAIDTPLGRLDSSHRIYVVERYLPFASHQVLLLSTDEEISGEYLKRLTPWIGRTYQLSYDDRTGETQIRPGYFETRDAA